MSDTPETDDLARGNHVVPTEFAQDLERQLRKVRDTVHRLRKQRAIARAYGEQMKRERDEAKNDLEFRREIYRFQENYLELARRERDEAIAEAKKLDGAYEDATNYYARWSELIEEREEARAVANELANIASHCLGWHDHESTETAEKLTNALKRWRNLKTQ